MLSSGEESSATAHLRVPEIDGVVAVERPNRRRRGRRERERLASLVKSRCADENIGEPNLDKRSARFVEAIRSAELREHLSQARLQGLGVADHIGVARGDEERRDRGHRRDPEPLDAPRERLLAEHPRLLDLAETGAGDRQDDLALHARRDVGRLDEIQRRFDERMRLSVAPRLQLEAGEVDPRPRADVRGALCSGP